MSTKERPTPETEDAIHRYWMGGSWSPEFASFARSLEKQRDELREALAWAMRDRNVPLHIPGQNDEYVADYTRYAALLTRNNDKKEDK